MRIVGRDIGKSKTTVMKAVHKLAARAKDSAWISANFNLSWSGILVVDGKRVRVYDRLVKHFNLSRYTNLEKKHLFIKTWICGIDYGTGDLPHYDLADDETKIDLILYFQSLKRNGYPLRVLVSDGNEDIIIAARKVYGNDVVHQLCTRHFIESLKRRAREAGHESNIKTNNLIADIQSVIEAHTLEASGLRLVQLQQAYNTHTDDIQNEIMNVFRKHQSALTAHLQYPDVHIPHTNNDIENLFRQLNLRLKTIGIFGCFRTARNYLKTWALWRRCTKFTDCRGERKGRNGRSPLQLACRTKLVDINFLSL